MIGRGTRRVSTMNSRMATVFTGLCVGFVGIVALLTWWQVIVAGELRQRDENNQTAYYEQRVQRGIISTSDGVRLAGRTARTGANGDTIYTRRYPQGSLAAHVLGYDTRGHSRAGVERAMNDALTGSSRDLGAVVGLLDGDEEAIGDDVQLTIDSRVQRVAERELAQTGAPGGAAVAIEPDSGRVLALASHPTFSPNDVVRDFASVAGGGSTRLFNRATQASYPPGSTFKVLTTAAALEGGMSPDRTFPGGCTFATPGPDLKNFGGSCPGSHDLTEALTKSHNVTFAQIGAELGDNAIREQMERFGFFQKPPLAGLPASEVRASGLYDGGDPLPATEGFDEARVAIGQDVLAVTPLQMALVTAGIANDGRVPEPTLVERVTRVGGGVAQRREPGVWTQAMEATTARALTEMMTSVVEFGSGAQAAIDGIEVAGKTGTADSSGGNITWFVAFAPADDPKVAVAVAIEGQSEGVTGGAVAAPIARQMMEAALGRGGVE